jgi:hypothetical protein
MNKRSKEVKNIKQKVLIQDHTLILLPVQIKLRRNVNGFVLVDSFFYN